MSEFQSIVDRLERQPGVQGVMLVGVDDGMVIAGDAGPGRESDTAAALAATLFRRTRAAAHRFGLAAVHVHSPTERPRRILNPFRTFSSNRASGVGCTTRTV